MQLRTVSALAAFGFDVLGSECPSAARLDRVDCFALAFQPKPATPLLVGRDAKVGDELSFGHKRLPLGIK